MVSVTRRDFCALAAGAVCATGVLGAIRGSGPPVETPDRALALPSIEFGRTGCRVPRLGFGCGPIADAVDDREAIDILLHAISLGVRYFDTAYSYGSGRSEKRVGAAMAQSGIDRGEFFVATKTDRKDKAGALQHLQTSLRRLQVEYVDAWQIHSLNYDPELLLQPGSVIEAMEQARTEGRIRFLGITSHEAPANMVRAIELYPFDLVLIPLSPVRQEYLGEFLPLAMQKGIGVVTMKPFGHGNLFREFTAHQLLHFALDRPGVHVVTPGLDAKWQVDEAFRAVAV